MKSFRLRLKRKALKKYVQIEDALQAFIQPFKEMPSVNDAGSVKDAGHENANRMNPHDLFSQYTADVINEVVMYTRLSNVVK